MAFAGFIVRREALKLLRLSILLLLVGCANHDAITPVADRVHTVTQFYDDIDKLRQACAGTGNPYAKGCTVCRDLSDYRGPYRACAIHVIKSQKCLDHENDHVIFDDFHPRNVNTACEVRAGG